MAAARANSSLALVHNSGLIEDVPLEQEDQEAIALQWVREVADTGILKCRGRGPRHGFDPLVPGDDLKNTWSFPVDDEPSQPRERYRLVQLCPDCRLVWRELVSGGGGEIPEPAKWRMWWDPRYKPPKGAGRIRSGMVRQESSRRMREDGTVAALAARKKPRKVLVYVEAADLRRADAAVRRGLRR